MMSERHIREPLPPRFPAGAAGLTSAWPLPGVSLLPSPAGAAAASFEPTPFADRRRQPVTVISKHLEMGQGTYTGLATIVAEEPDAAWAQVKVEGAPADAKRYNNLFFGGAQGTGGSTAMANLLGPDAPDRRHRPSHAGVRRSETLEGSGGRDHAWRKACCATPPVAARRALASLAEAAALEAVPARSPSGTRRISA